MANKLKGQFETVITPTLTLASLGAGAGRVAAQTDLGVGAIDRLFVIYAKITPATTSVIGELIGAYQAWAPSDQAGEEDGAVGVAVGDGA